MNKINSNELIKIYGGEVISATLLNAVTKCIDALLEVGRSIGSALRRIQSKNICP